MNLYIRQFYEKLLFTSVFTSEKFTSTADFKSERVLCDLQNIIFLPSLTFHFPTYNLDTQDGSMSFIILSNAHVAFTMCKSTS